jgi:UDP-N-acetylmuramoyl-tripeptide--D-alanyl-D-alanine ligase
MKQTPWTTSEVIDATGGRLVFGDKRLSFSQICIDSRKISAGDLFVAIVGENHDGHRFISDVIGSGVRGILVNDLDTESWEQHKGKGVVCIAVRNTKRALGDLAACLRKQSPVSVIAITGSNGKTTTKEMTTSVVAGRFRTLSTRGNFNNDIGLPLTLFDLRPEHEWAVLELGTNHPGEIERLAEICRPDIGVITNIGPAHLEGLGSVEGVMHAKGELLNNIQPNGTAVLNADDPNVRRLGKTAQVPVIYYGLSEQSAVRAKTLKEKKAGTSFVLKLPSEQIDIDLPVAGGFMVSNALAASAVGYLLGLSAHDIRSGLEMFVPVAGRMNVIVSKKGIHFIDDAYNANPASMEAAINTLNSLKGSERGFFVAGDMLELGAHAEALHEHIGAIAAGSNVTRLYVTGVFSPAVARGARQHGMAPQDIFLGTLEDIFQNITKRLLPGDWVLVKGSRAMGMERLVSRLLDWANG